MSRASGAVLTERIAELLRSSILRQADAPGTALTEKAVAARYGVARPTARLAIDKLVADGLLRREAHKAARVPLLSRDDVMDLYNNRAVVESAAVLSLAESGTIPPAALLAHQALMATEEFALHDISFHRALVAGQPSPRLRRMHDLLMGEIELCIGQVQMAGLLSSKEVSSQHQRILDAVLAGDATEAARLAHEHIVGARDRLVAHLDRPRTK